MKPKMGQRLHSLALAATLGLSTTLTGAAPPAAPDAPGLLPPWIVTESRMQPDISLVHASAWLGAETWSNRAVLTLADAFRHIPGAVMQESFGGFEPPRLSIRGSGVQSAPTSRGLMIRLDELPLGSADGSFNSALFDPLLGASVEVQRGLDGWRAAASTMGGALDLRSSGLTAPASAVLRSEAGSFGAWRGRAILARQHGETRGQFSIARVSQDGFREHSAQARTAALGTIEHSLRSDTQLAVGIYHVSARYEVPGPLTLAIARAFPRTISDDVRRDQPERDSAMTRVHAALVSRTAAAEFEFRAGLARTADDFRQLPANGITRSRSDDASLHALVARRFSTGAIPHQVRLVADATRGWRELRRFQNDAGRRGPEFAHDRVYPTTAAIQMEDAFALSPRLAGTAGLASVAARRDLADQRERSSISRWRGSRMLPQAGVRWKFDREIALFAGISSATEPPTFDDLIAVAGMPSSLVRRLNPLAAQRATTSEIGLRGRAQTLAWDVAAYDAHWRNEILRLADARGNALGAVNAERTRHQGVEAATRWRVLERGARLTVAASATWSRFRFDGDSVYGRHRLAGMPPVAGYTDLSFELPAGFFGAVGADWTHGQTLVDHAGRLGFGGRTLAHARVGWCGAGWTGFFEVRNLFDRAAIASTAGVLDVARNPAATAIFLPAPGRSINVGIEWKR